MIRFASFTIIIYALLLAAPCWAGQASISATVDRNVLDAGEYVILTVRVLNSDEKPDMSGLVDFTIRNQGSGSSTQWINGRTTRTHDYQFVLAPKRTGRLNIPAFSIREDGRTYSTRPIEIAVREQGRTATAQSPKNCFLRTRLSADKIYMGQQVVSSVMFFHRTQLLKSSYEKPSTDGFLSSDLDEKTYTSNQNGIRYYVNELSYVLTPIRPGNLIIGPARIRCQVEDTAQPRRRDVFGAFFGQSGIREYDLSSKERRVEVLPLPAYSGDVPFSGLVGEFRILAEVDRMDITPDETATLTVTITGRGNLTELSEYEPGLPDGIKAYADKPQEDVSVGVDGYRGSKNFKYALVPVKSGEYTVGPFKLSYFDPAKKQYRVVRTASFKIKAKAGQAAAPVQVPAVQAPKAAKKEVRLESRDILPISDSLSALDNGRPMGVWLFVVLMLLPPACFLAYTVWEKKRGTGPSHGQAMRKQALDSLDRARDAGDMDDFLLNLNRAVCSAVFSRTKDKSGTITVGEAEDILSGCGLGGDRAGFGELMARIDGCRFGGGCLEPAERGRLLADAKFFVQKVLK